MNISIPKTDKFTAEFLNLILEKQYSPLRVAFRDGPQQKPKSVRHMVLPSVSAGPIGWQTDLIPLRSLQNLTQVQTASDSGRKLGKTPRLIFLLHLSRNKYNLDLCSRCHSNLFQRLKREAIILSTLNP